MGRSNGHCIHANLERGLAFFIHSFDWRCPNDRIQKQKIGTLEFLLERRDLGQV